MMEYGKIFTIAEQTNSSFKSQIAKIKTSKLQNSISISIK